MTLLFLSAVLELLTSGYDRLSSKWTYPDSDVLRFAKNHQLDPIDMHMHHSHSQPGA